MALYVYAIVTYGDDWLGEFEVCRHSQKTDFNGVAGRTGMPPDMPHRAILHLSRYVTDKPSDYGPHILRADAETAVAKGIARWLDDDHDYVLFNEIGLTWLDLKEMPDLLVQNAENWWVLNRVSAIYELMKVLAAATHDGNARFVYWSA